MMSTRTRALKVYVPPGEHDEFYAFMSGGFSGQVTVHGLPSGRLLKIIPVFSLFPENGWGTSEDTKAMLNTSYGFIPWDDSHHPELSQTDGVPDGRWLFINANNTSSFVTPNTEYVVAATRFSVPAPQRDVPISSYKKNFEGRLTFIRANEPGKMDVAFQIRVPGYNYDLSHAGKGPSYGWAFFTSYNTEQAYELLEINASQNDKDFIAAVNWKRGEECVAQGKVKTVPATYYHNYLDESRIAHSEVKKSIKLLEPKDCEGLVYFLPTPKSPHGVDVDPSGEYIVAGGKLATVIPVHSFSKMLKAIEGV